MLIILSRWWGHKCLQFFPSFSPNFLHLKTVITKIGEEIISSIFPFPCPSQTLISDPDNNYSLLLISLQKASFAHLIRAPKFDTPCSWVPPVPSPCERWLPQLRSQHPSSDSTCHTVVFAGICMPCASSMPLCLCSCCSNCFILECLHFFKIPPRA